MKQLKILIFALSALILGYLSYQSVDARPRQAPTNFDAVHLRCEDCATATPALLVDQASGTGGGVVAEFQVAATPIARWLRSGGQDLLNQPISNIGNAGTDFNAQGGLTTATGITVTDGNLTVADFTRLVPQSTITVTSGGVLTPTGSFQPISSTGTVSITLMTTCTAGYQVTVLNLVAQAITISETTITDQLSGNAVLNQYDTLQLICGSSGNMWIQVAPESDN